MSHDDLKKDPPKEDYRVINTRIWLDLLTPAQRVDVLSRYCPVCGEPNGAQTGHPCFCHRGTAAQ